MLPVQEAHIKCVLYVLGTELQCYWRMWCLYVLDRRFVVQYLSFNLQSSLYFGEEKISAIFMVWAVSILVFMRAECNSFVLTDACRA